MRAPITVMLMLAATLASAQVPQGLDQTYPAAEKLYLELHQHPELSLHETETAAKIADRLKVLGYEVTTGVGGTGVVAVLKNGPGPVVMLRTELDALPIHEQTALPYASRVVTKDPAGAPIPVMHACGHDLHMAALTGTADWMAGHRLQWKGTLIVIGQPAEELGAGAKAMLQDGLFTRFPKPEVALAVHDTDGLPAGTVGYTPGYQLTGSDSVNITVYGRGGHGSRPHVTIDPIVIASRMVLAFQTIVAREITPGDHAVVTVGAFQAGTKNNIIPDEAKLQLTVREYKPEVRQQLLASIRRIAKYEALAGGAVREPLVEVTESTPATYNDPDLTNRLAATLISSLGKERVKQLPPDFPSEDFSYFVNAGVKGVMLRIGAVEPATFTAAQTSGEVLPGLHTARFAPDLKPSLQTAIETEVIALLDLMKR